MLGFDSHLFPLIVPFLCSSIMLERCVKRLEWERVRDKEQKDADDEAERERNAMQAIDW